MGPQTLADIIDNINPKRLHSSSSLRKHSSSSTHTQDEDPLQHIEEHKTSTIARGWTAQEDLIFERVLLLSHSSSTTMAPTSPLSKATYRRGHASRLKSGLTRFKARESVA